MARVAVVCGERAALGANYFLQWDSLRRTVVPDGDNRGGSGTLAAIDLIDNPVPLRELQFVLVDTCGHVPLVPWNNHFRCCWRTEER
jgi:hypothetical protein